MEILAVKDFNQATGVTTVVSDQAVALAVTTTDRKLHFLGLGVHNGKIVVVENTEEDL